MPRIKQEPLKRFYNEPICHTESICNKEILEIGVDEAGRGPLFGRVYTAAVILPKDDIFEYDKMKDSKKFTSHKKIIEVAEHIKKHALAWSVTYNDENTIDKINIRQSVLNSMHQSIKNVIEINNKSNIENDEQSQSQEPKPEPEYFLLVDGNDFKPYMCFKDDSFTHVNHICIEGGDNKYTAIAAASILAKVTRDRIMVSESEKHPEYLWYKNKGYGTAYHLNALKEFGYTSYHRKSFKGVIV